MSGKSRTQGIWGQPFWSLHSFDHSLYAPVFVMLCVLMLGCLVIKLDAEVIQKRTRVTFNSHVVVVVTGSNELGLL